MDYTDMTFLLLLSAIAILHCVLGILALTSTLDICINKKMHWCLLSIFFGPIGYYGYQHHIGLTIFVEEQLSGHENKHHR